VDPVHALTVLWGNFSKTLVRSCKTRTGCSLGRCAHLGSEPSACVMVGNSEPNDIQPAIALGMRAIRVAIEEPPPASSTAHAVVTRLYDALGLFRCWVETDDDWGLCESLSVLAVDTNPFAARRAA